MTSHRRRSGRVRAAAIATAGAVALATVVVLASRVEGYATTQVEMHAQTVWVTNDRVGPTLGRVNKQINELDAGLLLEGDLDVLQENDLVLVTDRLHREVGLVDVANVTVPNGRIPLAAQGDVVLGGGLLAVSDAGTGDVWVGTPMGLMGLDPEVTDPSFTAAAGLVVTVSQHGTVFATAPGETSLWAWAGGAGSAGDIDSDEERSDESEAPTADLTTLPGSPLGSAEVDGRAPVSITAVGDTPVVLDRETAEVIIGEHRVPVDGAGAGELQFPGPDADAAYLATAEGLYRIPLGLGDPELVSDEVRGTPVRPVVVGGCVHGAWAGADASYLFGCAGSAPVVRPLPGADAAEQLIFRVNRQVVVLNDRATGDVWMSDPDGLTLITNWEAVQDLPEDESDTKDDGDTAMSDDPTIESVNCETETPADPVLVKDEFGVRAGRATVLSVLDNDVLSECSASAIQTVGELDPTMGTLAVLGNGRAVQVDVPAGTAGTFSFEYTVTDGSYEPLTTSVSVKVYDTEPAQRPQPVRRPFVQVEVGGTVTYNVVEDFRSPTGDDLYLNAANLAQGSRDEISYLPNGEVTFTELSAVVGKREVAFTVADGQSEPVRGQLVIDVVPVGDAVLKPSPMFADGVVGEPLVLRPLDGVVHGGVEPIRLTTVELVTESDSVSQQIDTGSGVVTVSADEPGDHTYAYTVAAGEQAATGYLRVLFAERPLDPRPPVAVADVVYLRPDSQVRLDPTANDRDPMGGALAITHLDRRQAAGLSVELADLHLLTISAISKPPTGGVVVGYTVANGHDVATGQIRVIGVPAMPSPTPNARDISVTVRAGDGMTIPIADHANDPNGEPLTVTVDEDRLDADQGVVFATENAIRYRAPDAPPDKAVQFPYTVRTASGAQVTRSVSIRVTPDDPEVNSPPRTPQTAVARMYVDTQMPLPLPLDGIDPDGDWAMVSGLDVTGLRFSRVTQGLSALTVEALKRPGLDTVTYRVSDPDPWREEATGQAKVLVVERPKTVEPPTIPPLAVSTRPGRALGVDVLARVQDTTGELTFEEGSLKAPEGWDVRVADGVLVIDPPQQEGVEAIRFGVRNGKGLSASGVITVDVSETATVDPPIAHDVFADEKSLDLENRTATVDVGASLANPGGLAGDLEVEMVEGAAGDATVEKWTITVPLTQRRQVLAYQASDPTNPEGVPGRAFLVVPGLVDIPDPETEPDPVAEIVSTLPVEIDAGETKTFDIADLVILADGLRPTLVDGFDLTATAGTARRVNAASFSYEAPDDGTTEANLTVHVQADGEGEPQPASLEVVIRPAEVPPAEMVGTTLSVEAGTSQTLDLTPLVTTTLEDTDFEFSAGSAAYGFAADVVNTTLTVSVDLGVAEGTSAVIPITVTDGPDRPSATADVEVVARTSSEPLLRLSPIAVDDAAPGVPSSVNLQSAVTFNPFPGAPTLIAVGGPVGGSASVSQSGSTIVITPDPAFRAGTLTVPFTMADATGAASRQVDGVVSVTVRSEPDPPGTPKVVAGTVASKTLDLSWSIPKDNGYPITGYEVTGSPAFGPVQCPGSPCTITGLTNNVQYTFTVAARNERGLSAPSAPSGPATPDEIPSTPVPPVAEWDSTNSSLSVRWDAPPVDGSPIREYLLDISTPDKKGRTRVSTAETRFTWADLAQGQEYSFQVTAVNAAGKSAPSGFGRGDIPSVPPQPPVVNPLTFTATDYNESGNSLTVTWARPSDDGGRPITGYIVVVTADGARQTPVTVNADTTRSTFAAADGVTYTAEVQAENSRGRSPFAADGSGGVKPYRVPGTVTPTAVAGTASRLVPNKVTVSWKGAAGRGRTVSYYSVVDNGTEVAKVPSQGTDATHSIDLNAVRGNHTYTVAACYGSDVSHNACGSPGTTSAVAFDPVGRPSVSHVDTSQTQVRFNWSIPADNGRGPITVEISVDGGGWSANNSGTIVVGNACSQGHTIRVRARDSGGLYGQENSASGSSHSCPQPSVHVGHGPAVICSNGNAGSGCYIVHVALRNFPPNSSQHVCLYNREGNWDGYGYPGCFDVTVDGAGNWGFAQGGIRRWYGYPSGWVKAVVGSYNSGEGAWGS